MLHTFLQSQDFNDKDIEVYLDIYQHGQSYASTIALRTKLDRTTVYSVLKRLVNKGVIAQTKIDGVSAYIPVAPEIFLNQIDSQIDELKDQRQQTEQFLAELSKIKPQGYEKPRIQIYEGEEGIISLYEQTIQEAGQQKAFLTLKHIPLRIRNYLTGPFIKNKLANNVRSQVLIAESDRSTNYQQLDKTSNRETRIVKSHPFQIHSEIVLFGERSVAIIDFHQQAYGIVIESDTLYKTVETLFDLVWG